MMMRWIDERRRLKLGWDSRFDSRPIYIGKGYNSVSLVV